jgi:PAS domain S-box-containing protein
MEAGSPDSNGLSQLLVQPQRLLEELLNATPAVVYIKTLDGHYQFINRKFEGLFAVSRAEAQFKNDYEIFHDDPDLAENFRANDAWVAHTGESLQVEEIAPHLDGPHHYLSVKFPIRDEQGVIRYVAGISTDITEQIRASRRLADFQTRAESVLRAVGEGIVGLDPEGKVTIANPAACRLLGWPPEQIVGRRLIDLVQPTDLIGFPLTPEECPLARVLETRKPVDLVQCAFLTGREERLPVEISAIPQVLRGEIDSFVISFRDITTRLQRQQMQYDLQAAQEVQEHLYHLPPPIPGYDVAGRARPANNICGDYFDFIHRANQKLVIAIGDASGHDLAAAILMVHTRAYLRGLFDRDARVEEALHQLTDALAQDTKLGKFVSLFLAELDLEQRLLRYATAGHLGWLIRPDGQNLELRGNGMILGLYPTESPVDMKSIQLVTGDLLLLTTDGFVESTQARQQFGNERLIAVVREYSQLPAEQILDRMFEAVAAYSGRPIPKDDQTAVIVKVQ